VTVGELRQKLLHYALHAHHVTVLDHDQQLVAESTVDEYAPHGRRRHVIRMDMPVDYGKLGVLAKQMMLFDWLLESLGDEDGELLDYFATKLMERLGGSR